MKTGTEGLDLNHCCFHMCLQQLLQGPWGERFALHSDGKGSWEGKVDIFRHTEAQKGQSVGKHRWNASVPLPLPMCFLKEKLRRGMLSPRLYSGLA